MALACKARKCFERKRTVSRSSALWEARTCQICTEFLLLCCRPRKGRFMKETDCFSPICPFGARNGQICTEFLLLCCRPRKGRFFEETDSFWPICLFGARNGQICTEFLLLCCRPRKGRCQEETCRFAIFAIVPETKQMGDARKRSETLREAGKCLETVRQRFENVQKWSGKGRKTSRNGLGEAGRRRNPELEDQKWSGKLARKWSGRGLKTFRNGLGKAKKRSVAV